MRDLSDRSLDTAVRLGASYADVRVVHRLEESIDVKSGRVEGVASGESEGFGVRVLVDGGWGFASSSILTADEADRIADDAVRIARASATALRDRVVLRLIAADRAFHFVVLVALGIGVLLFAAHEATLRDAYYNILTDLQRGVGGGPVQDSGHVGILRDLDRLFSLRSGALREVGAALLGYGLLEGVEAVGLWLIKRWGEYFSVVATSIFLPLEIYELGERLTALRLIALVINLVAVVWLIWTKRLFGVRGGGAAYRAEHATESLLSVERAAVAGKA